MTGFDLPNSATSVPAAEPSAEVDVAEAVVAEVYVEVGARPTQLAPVRVVAADLAARADFDLDSVSDLRMAVDEACSTLAMLAAPGARLRCSMQINPAQITVTVRVTTPVGTEIARDTFGWRVLDTLIDEIDVLSENGSGPGTLGIRLVKVRRTGTA